MNSKYQKPLLAAVLKLLRPLVRILLRNGISYGTFSDTAKWIYVDMATNEFGIDGRKQSTSRVSVITGLSRKEVRRLQGLPKPDARAGTEKYNRGARVTAAWRRESDFLDTDGKPADLSMAGPWASFSELVRRFSGDVPARAVLDELIHVGVAEQLKNGKIRLLTDAYIPKSSETDKLHILGSDVAYLISTIDHNLRLDFSEARFQRKVAYDNLPDEVLPKFRALSGKKAKALLEKLDRWLSQHDRDASPNTEGTGRNVAGLGIYYFEEPHSNEDD
jgi:hypothetical protein